MQALVRAVFRKRRRLKPVLVRRHEIPNSRHLLREDEALLSQLIAGHTEVHATLPTNSTTIRTANLVVHVLSPDSIPLFSVRFRPAAKNHRIKNKRRPSTRMRRTPVESLHLEAGDFLKRRRVGHAQLLSKYGEMPIEIGDLGLLGAKEPFRILGSQLLGVCPRNTPAWKLTGGTHPRPPLHRRLGCVLTVLP